MNSSTRPYQSQRQGASRLAHRAEMPTVSLSGRVGRLLAWIGLAMQIQRERTRLAAMSDHELKDIGVTREQADRESYRGIADIPFNRLKRPTAHRRL